MARRIHDLDAVDRAIISELRADARLSIRALSERVHISRTAAHNRVQSLLSSGIITGFHAELDRQALGYGVQALVVVKVRDKPWNEIADELAALPCVDSVQAVSGDIDFILNISASSNDELSDTVMRRIHRIPGVLTARTYLVLESFEGTHDPLRTMSESA